MATLLNFLSFTVHVLCHLVPVFLETFDAEIPLDVAAPEVERAVVGVAAVSEVVEPGVVFVDIVFVADVAEPQASGDIALAFDVLVAVSVVAVGADSHVRPSFLAFPNVDHYASSSSSVEVVGQGPAHSSTGVRASYGLCSILSSPGPHQNRNLGYCDSEPNHGYNNASGTNDLPRGATTNHSRKTCLHLYQEQRTHRSYQATLSHPGVPQMRWVVAAQFQHLYLRLPLLELERRLPTPKGLSLKVTFSFCCLLLRKAYRFHRESQFTIAVVITESPSSSPMPKAMCATCMW
jgi:hypothetical protein